MTKFQVRPKDEKESETVQKAMFALGYRWKDSGTEIVSPGFFDAISAQSSGLMVMLNITQSEELKNIIPIAKAEKIIAEAMRRLFKENRKKGWSFYAACDLARSQLGIEQIHLKNYFHEGGVVSVEKPVDISAMLNKNPSTSISQEGEAAIETLKANGYTYHGGERWKPPLGDPKTFTPFWMVVGNGPASVRHYSYNEAVDEAKRLSQKEPGKLFFVLESMSAYCVELPNPSLYVPGRPELPF